jgi:ribosome-associated protein
LSDSVPNTSAESCARLSAEVAQLEKAEDVVVLDLRGLAGFTDFFVIATAASERRRATIVDAVERGVRERVGRKPIHLEGYPAAGWLLADYVDFVVHVFSPESRELYQLEKLWGDAARWSPEPAGADAAAASRTP